MSAAEKLEPSLLDTALEYAAKNLPVFPCDPTTKTPLVEHGFKDASTDADLIRRWWGRWPDAMIGMPTGSRTGFWALDVDDPAAFEAERVEQFARGHAKIMGVDPAGLAMAAPLAAAFGLSAQQQNTPQELEIRFGPFIPQASDRDEVIAAKIARLKEIARDQGGLALEQLGREDEIEPFIAELGAGGDNLAPSPPLSAAGFGATEQSIPLPPEMQAEYRSYLQQNAGRLDPDAYAAFRADLDRRYGFQGDPQAYRDFAIRANEAVQNGGRIGEEVPPIYENLSGVDRLRNDLVSNPLGAAGASYLDAATMGALGLLTGGGQRDALREASPVSSTIGEIAGGITGTMLAGGALGQVAGRVASPSIAKLLANPVVADMGYGAAYGATQADTGDRLTGAAAGIGGALAGNFIGQKVGRGSVIDGSG